ncbi:MAG: ATP-dependent zinc protease [Planctomycetota bacterium]|nr:MAG: ATP-dependent zinc protease [Planctomycetota bacterium]
MTASSKPGRAVCGWREWIALPAIGIETIKAKIDTGARSSSLHAFNIESFERNGQAWVSFVIHPLQRDTKTTLNAEAPVLEYRHVRSSSGHITHRPVILADIELDGKQWPIELTLASRDEMGFRMLLGREAVRGKFLVDPSRSYVVSKPRVSKATVKKPTKRKKRRRA